MSIKAYAVIYSGEREIALIGSARTEQEAEYIMQKDFLEVYSDNGFNENEFRVDVEVDGEWGYSKHGAWINGRHHTDHDWCIVEVELPSRNDAYDRFYDAADEVCLNCGCTERSCRTCPVRRTYEAMQRKEKRGAKDAQKVNR